MQLSEPPSFIQDVSKKRELFYTTGFQEDHKARSNGVFADDEYARQAQMVLDERLALFEYAVDDYDGGLLFFYFSSSDLQSHMFWWDSDEKHPLRSDAEAKKYFGHIKRHHYPGRIGSARAGSSPKRQTCQGWWNWRPQRMPQHPASPRRGLSRLIAEGWVTGRRDT